MQAATKETTEGIAEGTWTEEKDDAYIPNYAKGLTLDTFKPIVRNSEILPIFTNAIGNAINPQSAKIGNYGLFFQERILAIYHPNLHSTSEQFLLSGNSFSQEGGIVQLRGLATR